MLPLIANRTYYVATTGSDSNDGLTTGTPFLTVQKAVDTASALNLNFYNVTIQVADGTYSAPTIMLRSYQSTSGLITIQGNTTTPSNVVFSSAGDVIHGDAVYGRYVLNGFKVVSSGGVELLCCEPHQMWISRIWISAHVRPITFI